MALAKKKTTVKKSTVKKTTAKRAAVKRTSAKKPAVKKATVKKTTAKKTAAKKAAVKRTSAKKPAVKKATVKKTPVKKNIKVLSDTDKVINIIKRSKKGVAVATLKNKTGFNDKKISNIVYKAFKAGKIKRVDKGVYIAA